MVVFVSAYDHYALRAFEARALDYLVKPFSDARFAAALARAKERLREQERPGPEALAELLAALRPPPRPPFAERFLVPVGAKSVVVACAEIDWIEAADYYARLHCGGKSYAAARVLVRARAEARSRPLRAHPPLGDRPARPHRRGAPHFRADQVVVLKTGQRLTLSAARRKSLEDRLGSP